MNLDKNLKRFLTHAQWTGNVLSRKAGVPASTLHQWMTGGSCAFAPALESEAFTLSVPTTPSTLDLTADTAGAVWSLRKER